MYSSQSKNRRKSAKSTFHAKVLWSAIIISLSVISTLAQSTTPPSPPLGPASYRSDVKQIGVGLITGIVKSKAEEIVKTTNDMIIARGEPVRVELMSVRVNRPSRVATQFTNQPNEWFVKIPMNVGLKIRIPVSSDRQVYIPLDINISCNNWHTGQGALKVVGQPGPISIEGGNIIEEVLRIKDFVDSQVKQNFPPLRPITVPGVSLPCTTIGTSPGEPPDYRFGFVAYDGPSRIRPLDNAMVMPTIEVTFQRLKRLQARGRGGAVLYSPIENIVLDAFANFTMRQSGVLTMRENEEVALSLPPVSLRSSGVGTLVVIANINQQPSNQPQDSAFNAWSRTLNYSPGAHKLQITKVYSIPPGPMNPKPTFIRVPAYELTYNVRYSNPVTIR